MADDIDRANDYAEAERQAGLANFARHVRRLEESRHECLECGDKIPDDRRKAAPGCQYCVECQNVIDKGGSFWA